MVCYGVMVVGVCGDKILVDVRVCVGLGVDGRRNGDALRTHDGRQSDVNLRIFSLIFVWPWLIWTLVTRWRGHVSPEMRRRTDGLASLPYDRHLSFTNQVFRSCDRLGVRNGTKSKIEIDPIYIKIVTITFWMANLNKF